ncbi:hypothetical protein E4U58_001018 [Claviceps cyperi]|nr:hypothetical protein E4U58_001018 [Claviceps cyperi]
MDLLKKMLSWARDGGARKIVIPEYHTLIESEFTLLLNASPSLEHLKIWKPRGLSLPSNEKTWKQLRHVKISGCEICLPKLEETVPDGPSRIPSECCQLFGASHLGDNSTAMAQQRAENTPSSEAEDFENGRLDK